jgi:YVTN family beta-propeller protein
MGAVYRATDLRLERTVALKLIAPELAEQPRFRERFLRESRLAASLGHPHVLPVHAAGEEEGQLYLAMRFVDGEDLKSLLERETSLPVERALRICGQVAEALDAAHAKGLVHRDVKPANVLLDERGEAYLADFGLSKQLAGDSTQSGHVVGTLDYLAPEQIRGDPIDGRTDEYALACLLYACLAGQPPFHRETEAETLWAHMQEQPPGLRQNPALDQVFARALAKAKEERYPTCGDFLAATHAALGLEEPALRRRRRRRGLKLVLAGVALLVAAGIAAAVVELTTGGSAPAGLASVAPDGVGVVDASEARIIGRVPIPGGPSLVAAGRRFVWVASDANRTVSSISLDTLSVTHVIAPNATPSALAAEGDSVWVLDGNRRVVLRIDPAYGAVTRRIELPRAPPLPVTNRSLSSLSISTGEGALWVTDGSTRLLRIDPESGKVVAIDVHEPLDDVAVGFGAVWATSGRAASVFQIDVRGRAVKTRIPIVNRLGTAVPFPVAAAIGEGSVWVLNGNAQTVTRIDPRLAGVTATIPIGIGRNPSDIAAGAGAVWVANSGDGTLAQIDPETNVVRIIPLGSSPAGVAVGGGRVWVSVQPGFRAGLALPRVPVEASAAPSGALPASSCSPVEFQGKGQPQYLIASDLPFQGQASLAETLQLSDAIRFVLTRHHFRAGSYAVGYQSCDDSIAATGSYDVGRCRANAQAYATTKSVIGVIGAYNSGCTQVEIPVLAGARGGPLAMISATSTYVGLTHAGPGTAPGEPEKYYPRGRRNFVRVVAADDRQGAADALLAKQLRVTGLYLLNDGDPYGFGIAANVRDAARKLGISIAGFERYDIHAHTYTATARRVLRARADAVFIGGSSDLSNGPTLVKSLRAVLGDQVRILGPDGFTPISAFAQLSGPAAEGMTISFPAASASHLPEEGRRFIAAFGKAIGRPVEAYSVAAAQAAEVLLGAIARSDGTRASVTKELFKTKVTNGLLGSFSFDRNGDTTAGAVTIFRIEEGKGKVFTVITPPASLFR